MTRRWTIAWTRRTVLVALLWALTCAGAVAMTALAVTTTVDTSAGAWLAAFLAMGGDVIVFATVGAVLALRRPGNLVGLVLIASGLLVVATFGGFLAGASSSSGSSRPTL